MPKLYFIRHWQTEANVKGVLTGTLETNLTPKGIDDAKALANSLTEDFDYYYCSPLTRTHETLKAIKTQGNSSQCQCTNQPNGWTRTACEWWYFRVCDFTGGCFK